MRRKFVKYTPKPESLIKIPCVECGTPTPAPFYVEGVSEPVMCHNCYDNMMAESEGYFCVMCGREWGIDKRKDGKLYCSMCWQVWNS